MRCSSCSFRTLTARQGKASSAAAHKDPLSDSNDEALAAAQARVAALEKDLAASRAEAAEAEARVADAQAQAATERQQKETQLKTASKLADALELQNAEVTRALAAQRRAEDERAALQEKLASSVSSSMSAIY